MLLRFSGNKYFNILIYYSLDNTLSIPANTKKPGPVIYPLSQVPPITVSDYHQALADKISLIWETSVSQSIPCTIQASSRDSPWDAGQPRQCIPARIRIGAMLSSTWINCPMSMSLLISIIVSSFYFCYQYTQLFGLPRFYHHNTFFDILQVQHGLTYFSY